MKIPFRFRSGEPAALVLALLLAAGCRTVPRLPGTTSLDRPMLTTGYCSCGTCCGWRRNWFGRPVYSSGPNEGKRKAVGVTASGAQAHPGTIAADTSRYPFGTIMYVDGYGYGTVEDTGAGIKGEHIDLYFRSHEDAVRWGAQWKHVRVWLPQGGGSKLKSEVSDSLRGKS